jgi:gliding motility-associated lipoprotein GldH
MLITPLKKTNKERCPKVFINWSMALLLCFSLFSCDSFLYDSTVEIEKGTWVGTDSISFDFVIQDTTKLYHIFLEVDYDVDYAHQNVYCLVETYAPTGLAQRQIKSLELANQKGKWIGVCNDKTCVQKLPFITNTQFPSAGAYKIVFTQYTRKEMLEGVNNLRLTINEVSS